MAIYAVQGYSRSPILVPVKSPCRLMRHRIGLYVRITANSVGSPGVEVRPILSASKYRVHSYDLQ